MQIQTSESMMVRLGDLDRLLEVAGDVIISASNLQHVYREVLSLYESKHNVDDSALGGVREVAEAASRNGEHLHHLVQVIRTVTLKDLVFRARRTVREVARKTGKRVRLEVKGEETLLDKTIVEALVDPLSHQLRNAVTHGIEDPLLRATQGKPEEGVILIEITKNETETFLHVSDDGAGVDLECLKAKAVANGLLSQTDTLDESKALELICRPGVSTAKTVSETSGRGVGMDVVRDCLEQLGGGLAMETTKGKGTTFTYRIPLVSAVNILDALMVKAEPHSYAFPIINVVASLSVPASQVRTTMEQGRVVKYLGKLLNLHDLRRVLEPDMQEEEVTTETINMLIIEDKGRELALRVTDFGEPQKLVIIPFGNGLHVRGLMGTTILGGRELGFVVDVPAFLRRAVGLPEPSAVKSTLQSTLTETVTQQLDQDTQKTSEQAVTANPEAVYVLEAEKMLVPLNETLFLMENSEDEELVNKAFRHFHTIKGNFAMMCYPQTAETIHAVESVLNRIRDRQIAFSPEVMDIMMDGVAFVEDVLTQIKHGSWVDKLSQSIMTCSAALLPSREAGKIRDVGNENFQLSSESSYRLAAISKAGMPLYQCQVTFTQMEEPAFLRGCLIYKRLCQVGDVLATVPPLAEIERGLVDRRVKFLFASRHDPERLEAVLLRVMKEHYGVSTLKIGAYIS